MAEEQPYDQARARESAAEWVPVSELRGWTKNPRRNDGEPVDAVAKSIKRFGFGSPIIARREDGEVIAGHTRLKAAIKLGLDKVPVRFLDLDPAEAHLLALADNKVAEKSRWDDAMLIEIVSGYGRDDLDDAGFTDRDLEKLGASMDPGDSDSELGDVQYQIIVTCLGEADQAEKVQDLESRGYTCRPLML